MKDRFITIGRMIAASICGVIQFMLVIGGVTHWQKFASAHFPDVEFLQGDLGGIGGLVALLSLVWPMYVFATAKATYEKSIMKQNEKGA